jgi:hypothetical protein
MTVQRTALRLCKRKPRRCWVNHALTENCKGIKQLGEGLRQCSQMPRAVHLVCVPAHAAARVLAAAPAAHSIWSQRLRTPPSLKPSTELSLQLPPRGPRQLTRLPSRAPLLQLPPTTRSLRVVPRVPQMQFRPSQPMPHPKIRRPEGVAAPPRSVLSLLVWSGWTYRRCVSACLALYTLRN